MKQFWRRARRGIPWSLPFEIGAYLAGTAAAGIADRANLRFRRDLHVARDLYQVLAREFADRQPRPAELWQLLSRGNHEVQIPTSSEDLDPGHAILQLYTRLMYTAKSPGRRAELEAMWYEVTRLIGADETVHTNTDPGDASIVLSIPRRLRLPVSAPGDGQPSMRLRDAEAAAPAAAATIDHALARLFIRLGPPPESAPADYAPASSNGGGALQ
ncbi:hypothetical protein ACWCPM_10395 [Streptomyces sp. NPDC002309]